EALQISAIQSRSEYLYALDSYETAVENLDIAISIRDKTRIKYEEGLASSFELNEIESQFLEAQSQRIGSSIALMNALTQLRKAFNQL
ncbi:MAG: TolC family protein, partial [Flavobacteriales bacterium]|nr:TolC family protein [Flavobacteriales bacterium]